MATGGFGVCFIGKSFPITDSSFVRADQTHWVSVFSGVCRQHRCTISVPALSQVFDVSTVTPNYKELQEVSLFLVQPGTLDPSLALGLYISIGGAEWQYRGYVSNSQPSEVMPLQWPEDEPLTVGPGCIQLGVSLELQGMSFFNEAGAHVPTAGDHKHATKRQLSCHSANLAHGHCNRDEVPDCCSGLCS